MICTMEPIVVSLKIIRKKYVSWGIFAFFYLFLQIFFNNNAFFNLVEAELILRREETITLGTWRSPLLELIIFIILHLATYLLAMYSVEYSLKTVFSNLKSIQVKDLVKFVVMYLLINFVSLFIIGFLSELRNEVLDSFARTLLNILLLFLLSIFIYSKNPFVSSEKTNLFRSIKPYATSIAIICCISIAYSVTLAYIYSKVPHESFLGSGNIFAVFGLITKPQIPQWYDFMFILVNATFYTFVICSTYVLCKRMNGMQEV